jgi:hypothetical protein
MAFVRLCTHKRPIDAVALIHEKVLPFYDSHNVTVGAILADGGREYCGRPDQHLFELYLGSQNIEHRVTRPASPWTNGFVERFHRTLKDEFFAKAFREKWYDSLEELQKDLDAYMVRYNERRPHNGYRTKGRTPFQAFSDSGQPPLFRTVRLCELKTSKLFCTKKEKSKIQEHSNKSTATFWLS